MRARLSTPSALVVALTLASTISASALHAQDHAQHPPAMPADAPTESERAHVPPAPPANPLHDMSEERMIELMAMDDNAAHSLILFDELEWRSHSGGTQAAELQAWYGTDYHKLWFDAEAERVDDATDARVELKWDRIIARWWSLQAGVRHDVGRGPARTWAVIAVQGLAPGFLEVNASLYLSDEGRTAVRVSGEYDWLLTQRLILQPTLELDAYGEDDAQNGIGSGISTVEAGVRLRYEFRREIAPYVGVVWERAFGRTADLSRAQGERASELSGVLGVRIWF